MAQIVAGAARGKRIEIWFEDEARIGQKNKITRRWAKRGSRPSAPHDQRTRSAYIFGAICPEQGKAAALVMPWCDTYAMNQHLIEIARNVAEDAHAILIMDQAGWHMSNKLSVPENITILPLPPKSLPSDAATHGKDDDTGDFDTESFVAEAPPAKPDTSKDSPT